MHASRCLRTLLWLPVPGPAARASATLGLPALDRWGSPLSSVPIASLWRVCQIQRWHMLPRRGHQPVLLTGGCSGRGTTATLHPMPQTGPTATTRHPQQGKPAALSTAAGGPSTDGAVSNPDAWARLPVSRRACGVVQDFVGDGRRVLRSGAPRGPLLRCAAVQVHPAPVAGGACQHLWCPDCLPALQHSRHIAAGSSGKRRCCLHGAGCRFHRFRGYG